MVAGDERAIRQQLYSDIRAAGCGSAAGELELKTLPELNAMAAYWAAKVEGDELGMQRAAMAHNAAGLGRRPPRIGRTQLVINRLCLTAVIVGALYARNGPNTEVNDTITGIFLMIATIALFVWTDRIWKGRS
ncbi:MAG: hypothetical protein WA459_13590 [Stellaceae bacterium]